MDETVFSPTPAPAAPAKRRGCFGLALKTVLGCGAFALGSFLVLLLLLPTLCGGLVRSGVEQTFDQKFHGSLAVKELDLAWTHPQKITQAVLFDPEKHEVARVSAELPSILELARMQGPMKIRIDLDADLAADDHGAVNLQRAIEPRQKDAIVVKFPAEKKEPESPSDPIGRISGLDAEIVLASRHLSWSDAETRRAGRPFEVRDLEATLRMKPGQPLTVRAKGKVVSEAPGALDVDATIHGPIESGRPWPFGDVDAKVDVQGFSTAMVDGIAGLGGKLTEVLGPRFDVKVAATGVNPQKGEVEIGFTSPRTTFAFAGNFEGGLLRLREGTPTQLSLGVPRGFVTEMIQPKLPPGVSVAWDESAKPWTVSVTRLELPIPDASALDAKGLAKSLERLGCGVEIDLPAHVALESAETKAAHVRPAVDGLHATFAVAPGEPAKISFRAALDTGTPGAVEAVASVPDPWKSLAAGGVPKLDANVRVTGVSTAAIDALAGQGGRIAEAIGPSLQLNVEAKTVDADHGSVTANVDSANLKLSLRGASDPQTILRCTGEDGLDLAWTPPPGWIEKQVAPSLPEGSKLSTVAGAAGKVELHGREIAVPAGADLMKSLAFELSGSLPGASVSKGSGEKALPPMKLDPIAISAKMSPGGNLTAKVGTAIDGDTLTVRPIELDVRELALGLPSVKLEDLAGKVAVKIGSLRYADASSKNGQGAFAAKDLDLTAEVAPKKPLVAKLTAQVDAGPELGGGKLAANVSLPDPWYFLRAGAPAIPPVDADVSLPGLPLAPLDVLCGRPGLVSGLVGASADVVIAAKIASADSGSFTATVKSPTASIAAAAKLEKGMITASGAPAVEVDLPVTQAWLDQQVGPMLQPGAKLALADGKGTLHLSVQDVRLPVPQTPLKPEALASATAHLRATVPNLSYSDAKTDAAGGAAAIRDLAVQVDLSPGKPPEAKVGAKIEGQPPGELSVAVRALDPIANLAAEKGLSTYHVAAEVSAKSLPTGLVDALAAQGGMLVDVLGPRLDVAVHSDSISQADGTFTASMVSEKANVQCDRGSMMDGVLRLETVKGKNEALLARAGLTPLFSQKVVGSLVPALVNLEKPQGAEPVVLAVEQLQVPLDADLSKLDALVRLNLGEVSYKLLPGLAGLLGKGEATTVKMPEIRVPIQKGVASYDSLPIRIGGHDCVFKGTFSLVDKSFKMATQLPISALGKGVSGELDGFRGVVDANTMVPIELSGTWKNPKVSVGKDFLKKLGEDALKKQGGNLLDGLLKKKK